MAKIAGQKKGIDYFSLDVNFDEKVRLIDGKFGPIGIGILIKLWQIIYQEDGYFIKWSERQLLLYKTRINADIKLINDVINECLEWGIFNKELYEKHQVLTSSGIQKRYIEATIRRKEVVFIKEYLLVNFPQIYLKKVNVVINSINADINNISDDIYKQSKVKESKVKESKENHHDDSADDADKADHSLIFELAEKEFARPLRGSECQLLSSLLADNPIELVKEAIVRAVLNQAMHFKYVSSILHNWKMKGIRTLADVEREDQRFQKKKERKADYKRRKSKTVDNNTDQGERPWYYKQYDEREKMKKESGGG